MQPILIENTWYDISGFIKRHPGGNVIKSYIGEDATHVYHEMHRRSKLADKTLRNIPKVGDTSKLYIDRGNQLMLNDFEEWRTSLEQRGFFATSSSHITYRLVELFGIFSLATWLFHLESIWFKICSILLYGVFGGRCGWVQHEAGHNSFTGFISIDKTIQKATIGVGLLTSGSMWNVMHNRHHATTQKLGHDMDLDTMPFVLFNRDAFNENKVWSKLWLRYQAWTFLPITSGMFVMLFWIYYLHPRKMICDRDYTQMLFTIIGHIGRARIMSHVSRYSFYHSYLWLMGSMYVSGIYLFGHFSTSHSFTPIVKYDENPNWVEYSLNHTVDIDTQNPLVSWIMGYLNCQCVHHLFPQMPQYRHPEVSRELAVFAKKWNLTYRHVGYFEAWYYTFRNLNEVGKGFIND